MKERLLETLKENREVRKQTWLEETEGEGKNIPPSLSQWLYKGCCWGSINRTLTGVKRGENSSNRLKRDFSIRQFFSKLDSQLRVC